MEAARQELDLKKKGDEQRLNIKVKLVRHLLRFEADKKKIRKLLNFIKFYIPFEKGKYFHKFEKDIQQITKSRQAMGIEEAILQEFKEKGLREGLEQGLEQGFAKGVNEKEHIIITRAWKKGMPIEEIADLVDVPMEKVKAVIEELMGKEGDDVKS